MSLGFLLRMESLKLRVILARSEEQRLGFQENFKEFVTAGQFA